MVGKDEDATLEIGFENAEVVPADRSLPVPDLSPEAQKRLQVQMESVTEIGLINADIRAKMGVSDVPGKLPLRVFHIPTQRVVEPPNGTFDSFLTDKNSEG